MKISLISIFMFLVLVSSCDPGMVFDHFEAVDKRQWNWDDVKKFEVEITDSLQAYNIYANIRHTKDYPKSNIYLFITLKGPLESEIRDTIEIQIAKPNGQWMGTGFGEIKFVRKKFKSDVRFAHPGIYIFEVEQGMRINSIPVTDVGIRIEKYKSLN